jgi:hypothetical protein
MLHTEAGTNTFVDLIMGITKTSYTDCKNSCVNAPFCVPGSVSHTQYVHLLVHFANTKVCAQHTTFFYSDNNSYPIVIALL